MRNDFTAKEVQKLIGCGPQFIPALTKKFNKRKKPIWTPKQKAPQGKTTLYTYNEMLMLACLFAGRDFGFQRDEANFILEEIEDLMEYGIMDITITSVRGCKIIFEMQYIIELIRLNAVEEGIEL